MISASWSLQRADHGEQPYWAVILLASCLGQIGLPGRRLWLRLWLDVGHRRTAAGVPHARAWMSRANPLNRAIPGSAHRAVSAASRASLTTSTAGSSTYPDIRLVYWAGGNPFHHHQDINQLRAAFRRPETDRRA